MSEKSLPLSQQLCFALYSANHAMARLYRPLLSSLNLTYPQYLVLLALWEKDKMTVGDLGKALSLESNTVTPLLKRMEKAGWIERKRSDEDERIVFLKLTPTGRELEKESKRLAACVSRAASDGKTDIDELRGQIFSLSKRLRREAEVQSP